MECNLLTVSCPESDSQNSLGSPSKATYKTEICEELTRMPLSSLARCTPSYCKFNDLSNPLVKEVYAYTKQLTNTKDFKWYHVQNRPNCEIKNPLCKQDNISLLYVDEKTEVRRLGAKFLTSSTVIDQKTVSSHVNVTKSGSMEVSKQLEADQKTLMLFPFENEQDQYVSLNFLESRPFENLLHEKTLVPISGVFVKDKDIMMGPQSSNQEKTIEQNSRDLLDKLKYCDPSVDSKPGHPFDVSKPHDPLRYQEDGSCDIDIETDWDNSTFKVDSVENHLKQEHNYYCLVADKPILKSTISAKEKKKVLLTKTMSKEEGSGRATLQQIGSDVKEKEEMTKKREMEIIRRVADYRKRRLHTWRMQSQKRRHYLQAQFRRLGKLVITGMQTHSLTKRIPRYAILKEAIQEIHRLTLLSSKLSIDRDRLLVKNRNWTLYLREKMDNINNM